MNEEVRIATRRYGLGAAEQHELARRLASLKRLEPMTDNRRAMLIEAAVTFAALAARQRRLDMEEAADPARAS